MGWGRNDRENELATEAEKGGKGASERTGETIKGWRVTKKTHASSPSTSGKTHEKTCPIETRLETRESLCLPFLQLPKPHQSSATGPILDQRLMMVEA